MVSDCLEFKMRCSNLVTGAVKSYGGLIAARFFLGALEGGILPVIILYMSSIYKRHSLQLRVSFITASTALAGAFSGLLAAAIQQIKARGLPGWAWIFILVGYNFPLSLLRSY
jgi:MFS family permease